MPLFSSLRQASDPGPGERGRGAERGAASSALSGQSAEGREGSDHRGHLGSRNLPGQLRGGPEGRSGSSSRLWRVHGGAREDRAPTSSRAIK